MKICESQRLFWSPQFKLGRTKSIFCSLKFCWGPNTLGPPRIIVLSPQIQFTNSVYKHKCRPFKQRSSRNGLFVYKIGEFNMIYELLSLIPFVAIYALLGGPALTKSSWLGDRNQFIEPGSEDPFCLHSTQLTGGIHSTQSLGRLPSRRTWL